MKTNKLLFKPIKLLPMHIFLDSDSILWVSRRLSHQQSFIFKSKHLILIPKIHSVRNTIIRNFHIYSLLIVTYLVINLICDKNTDLNQVIRSENVSCKIYYPSSNLGKFFHVTWARFGSIESKSLPCLRENHFGLRRTYQHQLLS